MPAPWRLGSCERPEVSAVQANAAVERRRREPSGAIEGETINRAVVVAVREYLVPVASLEDANPVCPGEPGRNVMSIRRPGEAIDDLREPADAASELPSRGLENIKAVGLLQFETGPAPGDDKTPGRRYGDGKERALGTRTDSGAK